MKLFITIMAIYLSFILFAECLKIYIEWATMITKKPIPYPAIFDIVLPLILIVWAIVLLVK